MHEHLATEVLARLLHTQLQSLPAPRAEPPILCAALESERHGLGLDLAAVLLTLTGRPVMSLGTSLPTAEIAAAARGATAGVVLIGSSAAASPARLTDELARLRAGLPPGMPLLVGGHPPMTLPDGALSVPSFPALLAWAAPESEVRISSAR
jgi:methylmalonyl-CoA mutase cobalamin-binding subunit